ncbi:ribonuclease III [Novosphingobium ovatum]|nr:ribonuclease III [Novosphingobium ovatum]
MTLAGPKDPADLFDAPQWAEALTHGSYAPGTALPDYQRLEFLGDRVLGLVIAEWLHELGGDSEGRLSQRLNALVARPICADIARTQALGPHIRMGKQARDDGGSDSDNILGDVTEALIGASFVLRGFAPTRAMVRGLWADLVAGRTGQVKHPKSALQEWAAANRRKTPEYRLIDRSGPDHALRFTVGVAIKGVGEAQATASSKQEAETLAAAQFLSTFG